MKKMLQSFYVCCMTLFLFSCQKEFADNSVQNEIPASASSVGLNESSPETEEACGQLCTYSQGGWGSNPNGTNPGAYLHANFAAAFPNGLRVGSSNGYTVDYTSADAITNFLPVGGTVSALAGNATDPTSKSIRSVLIGQLTALALSVGFDNYDPNFGAGEVNLGSMIIGSGPFADKSVTEFLTMANDVLGGSSSAYTPDEVNETARAINNNYNGGAVDNGFVRCPTIR